MRLNADPDSKYAIQIAVKINISGANEGTYQKAVNQGHSPTTPALFGVPVSRISNSFSEAQRLGQIVVESNAYRKPCRLVFQPKLPRWHSLAAARSSVDSWTIWH